MAIPITPHTPLLLGRRQPPSPLILTRQPLTPLHWQHRCRVVSGSASNLHLPFSPESSAPNSKCRQPTYSKHDIELHVHSKARADVIWFVLLQSRWWSMFYLMFHFTFCRFNLVGQVCSNMLVVYLVQSGYGAPT